MHYHQSSSTRRAASRPRASSQHVVIVTTVAAAAILPLLLVLLLSPAPCRARSAFVTIQPRERQGHLVNTNDRKVLPNLQFPPQPRVSTLVSDHLSTTCRMATTDANTKEEIEVIRQPDDDFLGRKGVYDWGTWGCGVSKFPWTYDASESCYLLAGQVTVTPSDGRKPVTFGKGDFVTFPAGMSCTWDVTEAVKKHYMFY